MGVNNQPGVDMELNSDFDDGGFWVDIDSDVGGWTRCAVSYARSEGAAWRRAAKVLRKLADEAEEAGRNGC